ncbi:hypothetical protein NFI96_003775 [Prochilodus magdalenae]|nr:hypothetical protein NFI96_003775 [Prochilodus magdalenae]
MEGYSYPLTVEGPWPSTPTRTIRNKLQLYFQSKKKSQGGDCVVNFSEQTSAATVLFKTAEIRDQVLAKGDHSVTIDNQVVKLKVFKPADGKSRPEEPGGAATTGSDMAVKILQTSLNKSRSKPAMEPSLRGRSGDLSRSGAVVLEELPDNFSKDVFVLLVENISGFSEEEYFLEMISELNVAVVTFKDPNVAEKFLAESRTNKKFQQCGVTSRPLENTRSIKVGNLPARVSTELLELYFEKWGGAVEEITMIPEEQAAIITLQQQQGKRLCRQNSGKRSPYLQDTIYPYVMSLGTALYGKDRPEWKLPKPFTEKIHPAVREFLHKKDLISSILKQMESVFCQVNVDKAEVQLSPLPTLLKQKKITKKDIDSWRQNSTDEFRDILSSFDVFEHAVIPSIWSTAEKDIRSVVKDKAFMSMENGVLILAGMAQDIKLLKPILENVLRKASTLKCPPPYTHCFCNKICKALQRVNTQS